jgi:predicted nucleotidyltransferase
MPSRSFGSVKIFSPPFERDELVALLRERMAALKACLPVQRVVLCGSYATGRQAPGSDIDLVVIYAGPSRGDAYQLVRRSVNIPGLEPHVYTAREYEALQPTIDRMTTNGIPIIP